MECIFACENVEYPHRTAQTARRELAEIFRAKMAFDRGLDGAIDENLIIARPFAEPRGEVHHRTDGRIFEAAFGTDPAKRRVSLTTDDPIEHQRIALGNPFNVQLNSTETHMPLLYMPDR